MAYCDWLKGTALIGFKTWQDVYCGCLMSPFSYQSAAEIFQALLGLLHTDAAQIFWAVFGHFLARCEALASLWNDDGVFVGVGGVVKCTSLAL